VVRVPAETLIESEREGSQPADELREWARKHIRRVRGAKAHIVAFVLGMIVLIPLWIIVEWLSVGGFERFSDGDQPGEWEPWILYVAIPWGLCVAFIALSAYLDRPTTEADIDREVRRLASHG
jgi:2TM domain